MRDLASRLPPLSWRDFKAMVARSRAVAITLGTCLVLSVVAIYFATTIYSDLPLTHAGLLAMIAGIAFTLLVGIGLMTLIFYSSRAGYDRPPELERQNDDAGKPGSA